VGVSEGWAGSSLEQCGMGRKSSDVQKIMFLSKNLLKHIFEQKMLTDVSIIIFSFL